MNPQIENPNGLELSAGDIQLLERIFFRYRRVIVLKEFGVGLSGGRVLEVRPIKADGTPELPTVVKLGTSSMLEQEWNAYDVHIRNRLPHIAAVSDRPTLLPEAGRGALRYPVAGSGGHDIISLHDFCEQPDVDPARLEGVLARLLRIMENVWGFHHSTADFDMRASYDAALPPNLLLRAVTFDDDAVTTIAPGRLPERQFQPGDRVALRGFAVHKVDPTTHTITLRAPDGAPAFGARVRLAESQPMPDYRARQLIDVSGEVIETRASRLRTEVEALGAGHDVDAPRVLLAAHVWLPNPLHTLPELLGRTRQVNVATIHGDFNLQNILVDPQLGDISLIDFAEARHDHVLHDLLHLEAEIVTHLLSAAITQRQLDPAQALAELSWQLHRAMADPARDPGQPVPRALRKPWAMLRAIRLTARRYLFDAADTGEFYQGLALYLLGALRFKNLSARPDHPLPKRLAFLWSALACLWLEHPDARTPPEELKPLLDPARSLWSAARPHEQPDLDEFELLASLPTDKLPPVGGLPGVACMPLERNPRFVARQKELQRLATTLKCEQNLRLAAAVGHTQTADVLGFMIEPTLFAEARGACPPAAAIAVAGLGGVGKTQLACEFVHRCGRFFKGGVFWIACGDPAAVPAAIAACGDRRGLKLRPNFDELPLEQQVQLVLEEWRKPIPRLLIFDNCETPELLERFLPREGGCRALITSRRGDWQSELGLAMLELDVLPRPASLELLRAHQPDADTAQLDAIAQELGDLPLALHLAGSYLARYRHVTDATDYLANLRAASPLGHQSLQGRALLPTEHDGHVARSFALSYDQLDRADPASRLARGLLFGAACLAPSQPIPEALVRLALNAQQDQAAGVVRAGFEIGSAIDALVELGLVRVEAEGTLWLHRLMATFTRDHAGPGFARVQAAVERALAAEAERLNKLRDPSQLRGWQAHLRHVADTALPHGDEMAADLAHSLAEHLYQTGDYPGARDNHERALHIRQKLFGPDDPAVARSLTQIGKALLFYGDAIHARPYFEQALAIQQGKLGDHNDTATTLNHLGFLLMRHNELDAARNYHTEALRMRCKLLGAEHPAITDSLSNLAYVEYMQGRLDAAHDLLQQSITIQSRARGDRHPDIARLLTNFGELLISQHKLDEAEYTFNRALAIYELELGLSHPETARTLGHLGDVCRLKNDTTRARQFYERALEIFRICHGDEHFRTRWVLKQLHLLTCPN